MEDSRGFVHHNYYESVPSQSSAILLNDSCPIIPEPIGLGLEFPRLGQYRTKTNMATIHKASRARAKTIGLEFQRLGLYRVRIHKAEPHRARVGSIILIIFRDPIALA